LAFRILRLKLRHEERLRGRVHRAIQDGKSRPRGPASLDQMPPAVSDLGEDSPRSREVGKVEEAVRHLVEESRKRSQNLVVLFMAKGLVAGETRHEADEFLALEPMLLSRALELIESGEIKDAKTALGLLFAAGFRAGR